MNSNVAVVAPMSKRMPKALDSLTETQVDSLHNTYGEVRVFYASLRPSLEEIEEYNGKIKALIILETATEVNSLLIARIKGDRRFDRFDLLVPDSETDQLVKVDTVEKIKYTTIPL